MSALRATLQCSARAHQFSGLRLRRVSLLACSRRASARRVRPHAPCAPHQPPAGPRAALLSCSSTWQACRAVRPPPARRASAAVHWPRAAHRRACMAARENCLLSSAVCSCSLEQSSWPASSAALVRELSTESLERRPCVGDARHETPGAATCTRRAVHPTPPSQQRRPRRVSSRRGSQKPAPRAELGRGLPYLQLLASDGDAARRRRHGLRRHAAARRTDACDEARSAVAIALVP